MNATPTIDPQDSLPPTQLVTPPSSRFSRHVVALLAGMFIVLIALGGIWAIVNHTVGSRTTTAVTATQTLSTPIVPTSIPTLTPVPTFSPELAWGQHYDTLVSPLLAGGMQIYVEDISPDAHTLVGIVSPQGNSTGKQTFIGSVDVNTHAVTDWYDIPLDASPNCETDGRYIAWISPSAYTGGPGGPPHQIVGYVDTQTGRVTTLYDGYTLYAEPNNFFAVTHGYFFWGKSGNIAVLEATNMANGTTQTIPSPANSSNLNLVLPIVSWPYVLLPYQGYAYDMDTGQGITPAQLDATQITNQYETVAISGTTLFVRDRQGHIQEFDHFDQSGGPGIPIPMVVSANAEISANARLLIGLAQVWDRSQRRIIELPLHTFLGPTQEYPIVNGDALLFSVDDPQHPGDPTFSDYAVVDTTQLP